MCAQNKQNRLPLKELPDEHRKVLRVKRKSWCPESGRRTGWNCLCNKAKNKKAKQKKRQQTLLKHVEKRSCCCCGGAASLLWACVSVKMCQNSSLTSQSPSWSGGAKTAASLTAQRWWRTETAVKEQTASGYTAKDQLAGTNSGQSALYDITKPW